MLELDLSSDKLVSRLLQASNTESVCILDSCGVRHLGSHLLIAGISPVETIEFSSNDPQKTLDLLDKKLSSGLGAIFTISYDFGLKLERITPREKKFLTPPEPDIFISLFDCLIVHDYTTAKTFLTGNESGFDSVKDLLLTDLKYDLDRQPVFPPTVSSNFTKRDYIDSIEQVKEYIRRGDTYQANLTQQLRAILPVDLTPEYIFWRLRKDHPAPFAAFIKRSDSTVISASPERFIRTASSELNPVLNSKLDTPNSQLIRASPIKGTRPRGKTPDEDQKLRLELINSEKDRAENTMIVDLLRNDLGRICDFGSVKVEKLCELEEHPSLFHLVSTVTGELRNDLNLSDVIRAVFPCGSITGAPKIRTMQVIDEIETANRGLSMGAIGICVQSPDLSDDFGLWTLDFGLDMSVAIRTMVVRGNEAVFNVGGGIVIDSDPEKEYEETLIKAKALLEAMGASSEFQLLAS